MNNEKYISEIVANVIKSINAGGEVKPAQNGNHLKGVFSSMTDALAAVSKAYTELKKYSVAQREEMIKNIRRLTLEEAEIMAKLGVEETGMGNVADKIVKHQLVAKKTPGTEDLKPTVITLRRKGSLLAWRGSPGAVFLSSGQSALIISL